MDFSDPQRNYFACSIFKIIPSSNLQNALGFGTWNLVPGIGNLVLGIWCLEFGAC